MQYFSVKNSILNFFRPSLRNKKFLKSSNSILNVVDVGSTGGLDIRWNIINEFIKADPNNIKTGKKIPFFKLGEKNEWKNFLDNKVRKKIESAFKKEMIELNYL